MDQEEREAMEMTKDELLARAAKTRPADVVRNREDFAQRMHRVVGVTIERSEREDPIETVFVPNFFRVTPATLQEPPAPKTEAHEPGHPAKAEFRTVPAA
jgi:hypothetical protein